MRTLRQVMLVLGVAGWSRGGSARGRVRGWRLRSLSGSALAVKPGVLAMRVCGRGSVASRGLASCWIADVRGCGVFVGGELVGVGGVAGRGDVLSVAGRTNLYGARWSDVCADLGARRERRGGLEGGIDGRCRWRRHAGDGDCGGLARTAVGCVRRICWEPRDGARRGDVRSTTTRQFHRVAASGGSTVVAGSGGGRRRSVPRRWGWRRRRHHSFSRRTLALTSLTPAAAEAAEAAVASPAMAVARAAIAVFVRPRGWTSLPQPRFPGSGPGHGLGGAAAVVGGGSAGSKAGVSTSAGGGGGGGGGPGHWRRRHRRRWRGRRWWRRRSRGKLR